MSQTFVIGMMLNATANIGAAMSGVGRVGSALDALSHRRLTLQTDLRPFRETEAALAQVDRRIGALNTRKLQLQQQLAGAPEKAGELQAALDKVGGRLDRLNSKRVQLAAELEKGRTAASGLEREIGKVTAASERLGSSMAAMKARADLRREIQGNILGTVAMGAALAAPVKVAIDFESAMADVRKAADLDPSGVRQMGDAILALSRRVPMAATGLATIMAEAGRAGIAREELLGFAEDAARVGVAFDMSAEEAGSAMVGLRSIFKLNREQIAAVGDAYNDLDNNMAATAKDMLEIANRSGSTARLFGLNAVQLGALGASFLELKTPPEIAARATNGLLMKLKTASSQGTDFQQALASIGLSAQGMEAAIRNDAEAALVMFLKQAKAAENPLAVLNDLVGQGFADDVAKLVDSVDIYEKAIGIVSDKTKMAGSMQREYQNRLDTTANELQLLRNELTRTAVHLGGVFLPGTRLVAKGLGSVLGAADALGQKVPWLTATVGGLAAGLITLKLGSMGVRWAWTFVKDGIDALKIGYTLLTTTVRAATFAQRWQQVESALLAGKQWVLATATRGYAMATTVAAWASRAFAAGMRVASLAVAGNPIGLVITALAIGAGLLIANWSTVGPFFSAMWTQVTAGAEWAKTKLTAMWQWVSGLSLRDAGAKIIGSLWDGMASMANKPVELMKSVVGKIRNLLPFSPAKEGPLADLDQVRLIETIAESIRPEPLLTAMRRTAAAVATAGVLGMGGTMPVTIEPLLAPMTPPSLPSAVQQVRRVAPMSQPTVPPAEASATRPGNQQTRQVSGPVGRTSAPSSSITIHAPITVTVQGPGPTGSPEEIGRRIGRESGLELERTLRRKYAI